MKCDTHLQVFSLPTARTVYIESNYHKMLVENGCMFFLSTHKEVESHNKDRLRVQRGDKRARGGDRRKPMCRVEHIDCFCQNSHLASLNEPVMSHRAGGGGRGKEREAVFYKMVTARVDVWTLESWEELSEWIQSNQTSHTDQRTSAAINPHRLLKSDCGDGCSTNTGNMIQRTEVVEE